MTTSIKGFGVCPAGTTAFGYGSPAEADPNVGKAFTKSDGTQGSSRYINPRTRDYSIDANGRSVGMDDVQQLVYLALVTIKRSSVVPGLGQDFTSIKVITENIKAQITDQVNQALSNLVASGQVKLNLVEITKTPSNQILIQIEWIDLTKNTKNIFSI